MIISGGNTYVYGKGFDKTNIQIENGKITALGIDAVGDVFDADGMYVLPGFIDIHSHGAVGVDFMDADAEGMCKIKKYMAQNGVTSFCATTMTMPYDRIIKTVKAAREAAECKEGANLVGIYMEGPFFCEKYKGGQNKEYLKNPDAAWAAKLIEDAEGFIKVMCVAPELDGAEEFIKAVSGTNTVVSAAHTNADYDTFLKVYQCGLSNVTHLYNAMSPLSHRAPGVVGAAFDTDTTAEIICDGVHIHPAAVRTAVKAKGYDKMILISDSMRAAGMPDGVYDLGGQNINVADGKAYTESGNLAGSTSNLLACFQNIVRWGLDLEGAVKMSSENAARVINEKDKGKILVGADADFVILNAELERVATIVGGNII